MAKKEKAQEPVKTNQSGIPTHGIFGLGLMFAAASTLVADYFVYFGTDDPIIKLLLIPNVIAVTAFLVVKALK